MKNMIDSHVHMDHKRFDSNRKEIIELAHDSGIELMVNPAIGFETNYSMRNTLDSYDFIKYAVGIHPNRIGIEENVDEEWERGLLSLLTGTDKSPKTVAVGETGLDFHRLTRDTNGEIDETSRITVRRQYIWFRKQLQLAAMVKLPLILHIRNAEAEAIRQSNELAEDTILEYIDADKEAIEILKEINQELLPGIKGVVHCFTSKRMEAAEEYIKMGYMLGIGGAFTRPESEELRKIIKKVPLESIILETDSPFVMPVGMTEAGAGKRNTPMSIPYIAEKLAELKDIPVDEVATVTTENTKRLFRME